MKLLALLLAALFALPLVTTDPPAGQGDAAAAVAGAALENARPSRRAAATRARSSSG